MLISVILQTLWFLLPAGAANMAPVFAAHLFPSWNTPVDLGHSFQGQRIFGDHKTIRGLIAGTLVGGLVFILQRALFARFEILSPLAYPDFATAPLWFGSLQGFSALIGDLAKSFIKRLRAIRPGGPWMPFDQIDWAIGTAIGSAFVIQITLLQSLIAITLAFALSLSAHLSGYKLGLNRDPV